MAQANLTVGGDSVTLLAQFLASDGTLAQGTVTWTSSDDAVATVAVDPNNDRSATVSPVAVGSADIVASISTSSGASVHSNAFGIDVAAGPVPGDAVSGEITVA